MFSNQYGYYEIYGNNYSQKISYENIVEILLKQNCFIQIGNQEFKNNSNFPWINIAIAYTEDGNYLIKNEKIEEINLITVVTSKNIDQAIYIKLLLKIAKEINWELYLEEDNYGNENVKVISVM